MWKEKYNRTEEFVCFEKRNKWEENEEIFLNEIYYFWLLNIWLLFVNWSVLKQMLFFIEFSKCIIWRSYFRYLFRIELNLKHLFKVSKVFFDPYRFVNLVSCVIMSVTWFVSVNLNKKYQIKLLHFILIFNDKENCKRKDLLLFSKTSFSTSTYSSSKFCFDDLSSSKTTKFVLYCDI